MLVGNKLTDNAKKILEQSTRPSTKKKYASKERQWLAYCEEKGMDPVCTDSSQFANFLAHQFDRGLKYNSVLGYRAALPAYTPKVDPHLTRSMMRGMFNLRPPKARYTAVWDVNQVLVFLSAMIATQPMDISCKTATLLMLLSGNRVNMLSNMKWTNMYVTESEVTFTVDSVLKHNRSTSELPMVFRAYTHEPTLCPVTTVGKYLDFRRDKSGEPELFITTRPTKGAYKAATSDTIARWIKKTMGLAGIDTGKFTAHSCSLQVRFHIIC